MTVDDYRVVPLGPAQVGGAEAVLSESFPDGLVAQLGERAVRAFLQSFVVQPGAFGLACLREDRVVGFLLACEDAAWHQRTLVRREGPGLLGSIFGRAGRSPRLAYRLARRALMLARRRIPAARPTAVAGLPAASLVLMAIDSHHRGRRLADRLMRAFLWQLAERGIPRVKLVVEAVNVPAVRLYLAHAWQIDSRQHTTDGQSMYRMVRELPVGATPDHRGTWDIPTELEPPPDHTGEQPFGSV